MKKQNIFKIGIIGLVMTLNAGVLSFQTVQPVRVQAATSQKQALRQFVRKTMAKHHVRGSIVVIKNGVPQKISYGYALSNRKIGNGNRKVVYPTGSLQKVITGAMIVQIMDEKKETNQEFDQNTKIDRWFPSLKNAQKISVGNLLTHTSGIKPPNTEVWRHHNYSESAAIKMTIANANQFSFAKVGKYHYNNANYILLAGIIRQETRQSYQTNLRKRIVKPLGLTSTFTAASLPKSKLIAGSYYSNGGANYRNPVYLTKAFASQMLGAGNLLTTPMEYYQIQCGLTNGTILTQKQFQYLTNLASKTTAYSGGLHIKKSGKLKIAYGNLHGTHFGMWVQLTSDNQTGIVMFLNQTNNSAAKEKKVGYSILQHIAPGTFLPK
ncbi:serine hydrolase domain-containing protein [Lactobacillus sp. ESL0677]|uniref:serine hydrolase domain-containing protein n=1 Tax=Lactobacillus sp. ESL0677 TaxID=2983208 RepID=UPI0023F86C7C|nr:serine hydrolase domain-containing protein [Lactobacillus sp. ESL0677]WEV36538.1 serine hydrolase [Lactobacillus sp. ESL0677]